MKSEFLIDESRVYIMGQSLGGLVSGTLLPSAPTFLQQASRFAGWVILSA
jgi:predicted peptidase